ncbi:hypothetical protein AGMMS4957_18630 [Bacteroidia bacterium]|nr:hypothetical protein AGMMS4957_18630 [Bacteroidia bacterium]
MRVTKNYNLLLATLVLLFLAGYVPCRAANTSDDEEFALPALTTLTTTERLAAVRQASLSFQTLSANLVMSLTQGGKNDFSTDVQMRIIKDQAIQLSARVPFLGEAVKIVITPENVLIINRLNKTFFYETVQNIKEGKEIDFDYYSLEALFTNRLFIAGKQTVTPDDDTCFAVNDSEFETNLIITDNQHIQYSFVTDQTNNHIQLLQMSHPAFPVNVQCVYEDWRLVSNMQAFPMSLQLTAIVPDNDCGIAMRFSSVHLDTTFTIDDAPPNSAKYKQLSFQQMIELTMKSL